MTKEVRELMKLFGNSFINAQNELILIPKTNLYFRLDDVRNKKDLIYKIIAWCSRDASKSKPYRREKYNEKYREYVIDRLNCFLGVAWSEERWLDLYTLYGNGIHKEDCIKMIDNNF